MQSFDSFWNGVAVPNIEKILDPLREDAKNAESTADVITDLVVRYSKALLEAYHSWLLQNLQDQN